MTEAIAAAAKALLKKVAVDIALDKDKRNKFLLIVSSIVVGVIFLLMTPIVVLSSLGNMEFEPPEIDKSMFNEAAFIQNLSSDQQAQIANLQNQGRLSRTL